MKTNYDPNEKKLYYSDISHSKRYLSIRKNDTAVLRTMAGARRGRTDAKTNAAEPNDDDVAEMRNWSQENKL